MASLNACKSSNVEAGLFITPLADANACASIPLPGSIIANVSFKPASLAFKAFNFLSAAVTTLS